MVRRPTLHNSLSAIAATFMLLTNGPAIALSGSPLPFDSYTVNQGQISAACDNWTTGPKTLNITSVTCGPELVSDGMLQREVTIESSDSQYSGTYIQFIIVDPNASGDASANPFSTARGSLTFSNEDFIKMNNRGPGIASKQTILEAKFDDATNQETRFEDVTTYEWGWAHGQAFNDPWIEVQQDVTALQYNDAKALATSAYEIMNQHLDLIKDNIDQSNTKVAIDERMLLEDPKGVANDAVQKFKYTRISGQFTSLGSDAAGLGANINPLLVGGTTGGNIDWTLGNTLAATWLGYGVVDGASSFSNIFGFTSLENRSVVPSGRDYTKRVSFTDPEAGGPAPACPPTNTAFSFQYNSSTGQCDVYRISNGAYLGDTPPSAPGGWNGILGADLLPLFGTAPLFADAAPVPQLTDYSVLTPVVTLPPSARLDYIANSSATPTPNSNPFVLTAADYNQWLVTNGVFSNVACPASADYCGPTIVNEGGLYQRKVMVAGEVYYQTIVVDSNATGDPTLAAFSVGSIGFSNETFIKVGAGSGIANNAHLAQLGTTSYLYAGTGFDLPNDAGNFSQDVVLNSGWANQGTVLNPTTGAIEPHAVIAIDQSLSVPEYDVTFTASTAQHFTLERGMSEADKRMTLYAEVGTLSGTVATPFIEPIILKTVTVTGAYQQTARTDFVDPFVLPSAQADLPWVAGDALQATWIGAHYGTNPRVPATNLNTTSFTNRTTSESVGYTGLEYVPTGPDNWFVDPFLTAPTYP